TSSAFMCFFTWPSTAEIYTLSLHDALPISEGRNVFQGGFLGLDNIGVFDRSKPLPTGGQLEQSDGTAWMGMYCLNMLAIALELRSEEHTSELQSLRHLVCRLLLEKKKKKNK